jgi:hypothetical protein
MLKSTDERIRQMGLTQLFNATNTHLNSSWNMRPAHSNSQERAKTPPRTEAVNIEDVSIQFLCKSSTRPNWRQIVSSCNDYGQTMAHISVTLGYSRLLQHLITWEIDLNAVDNIGFTALHYAYLFSQGECARFLIHSGADPLILDDLGRSPSDLDPSMEVMLHPIVDKGGYSAHSTPSVDCNNEMPEADGLCGKQLLVQHWRQQIEDERRFEQPPLRDQRQEDIWGRPEASTPASDSTDENVGEVIHRQSLSLGLSFPQEFPTLVASEALSETAVPSGVVSPPVRTPAHLKVDIPVHTASKGRRGLIRSKIVPQAPVCGSHSGA